jgi:replicative DNA helicase
MSNVVPLGGRGLTLTPETVTSSALDQAAEFWERLAKVGPTKVNLGFPRWEHLTDPRPYQYVVLAARPGMYKTTVAWTWALNLAMSGKRVLWVGLDMPASDMAGWALARLTGIPSRRLMEAGRGILSLTSSEQLTLADSERRLGTLPLVMWRRSSIDLKSLWQAATRVPYDAVFLDYVQQVQSPGLNESDRVANTSKAIRQMVTDHPLYFVALAQMNREIERPPNGKPRLPALADLKGSSQLEADPDAVAFMYRPDFGPHQDRSKVQMVIRKNRGGPPDGAIDLQAYPETRFIEETLT